jgi:hypothetical protein
MGSRPSNDKYEKVLASDPELESNSQRTEDEDDSIVPKWDHAYRKRSLLSIVWLCMRAALIVASIIAWGASLWLTHLATIELGKARALIPHSPATTITRPAKTVTVTANLPIPTQNDHKADDHDNKGHKITNPNHESLNTMFIPGGQLPVAGYGLAYNTSYCNGWSDPEGAQARGCVLDPSQGGWVHELCHDPELRAEWLRLPDFGWWLDAQRTQPIPQERIWAADIPGGVHTEVFTPQAFHIEHCKFVMRLRVKHTTRRNRGLGYLPLDPGHMYHCLHIMTEDDDPTALTKVVLGEFGGGTSGFGLGGECYMPIL